MQCRQIQQLIPDYVQGGLTNDIKTRLEAHLNTCHGCREEARLMKKTWRLIGEVEDIEPAPNYISRFWTGIESRRPWYEKIFLQTKEIVFQRPWVPALAAAGVILIAAGIALHINDRFPDNEMAVVAASRDVDPELVEHIDIIENLDLIQDIDFYTDLEVIENLDEFEAS